MKTIHVQRKPIDIKQYRFRRADEKDCSNLIDEDALIYIDGKLEIIYIAKVAEDMTAFYDALTKIKYDKSTRTSGLVTTSRIFGYAPRNVIRNAPCRASSCRASSLAGESPQHHKAIMRAASVAAKYYRKYNPELASLHQQLTDEKVLGNYRMGDTMFTSGIINDNNPLLYHYDAGNYRGVYSAMFGFKKGIEGGYLAVPEIDTHLKISDKSLSLFDGQGLLHGVTPIRKTHPDAKRYTIVYYSLQQMWNCETPGTELEILRNRRTEYERRRASEAKEKTKK
jgi:hypothetical protein